ncbi:aminotransferase class V-fold PLP-dependent enzyme [Cellulosispirillum alkaliphilum]|uniref:aminotransferase class V-fold PLP-dependent enzyme n=1 Tax=Cellulosispirillum alkaliphilum TaxID=3039283 RepID=UPI003D700A7F
MNVERVRSSFPILSKKINGSTLVYFDNSATTHKPVQVIDSVSQFYCQWNSNIHRGIHYLSEKATEMYESSRESVREFIGAENSSEIIFTRGTTEAINMVATCFGAVNVSEGDEIIISEMEHHSNLVPWQVLCKQKKATLKVIPITDNGILRADLLLSLITQKTKLIAITMVSNVLGTVNPVNAIIKTAHSFNIPVVLDAAQCIQHTKIDVKELDCDFVAFSGHKMYAQTGIGVLYGKKKWLDTISAYQYGGGMISSVDLFSTEFCSPPNKFEAGTPNISGALSLKAAIDFLNDIGLNSIEQHEKNLMEYATQKLMELEHITIYGPQTNRTGALSFNIDGISSYDVAALLDRMAIAVRSGTHCAQPLMKRLGIKNCIRASFALYNTNQEIDLFIQGIKRVLNLLT